MLLADVTPALILAFLDHLESERHNAVRSRNARLAALRTFLKFAARRDVTAWRGSPSRDGARFIARACRSNGLYPPIRTSSSAAAR